MELEPTRTAVVVVDMVNWQVPKDVPEGAYWTQYYVDRCAELVVPAHQRLLPAARAAGARIVFLRVGASESDYSDGIRFFREGFRMYGARTDQPECEVIPELAPEAGDVTLAKRGSGGYTTSDLDSCLRGLGVDTVLYTGVATNVCVLLTASAGFDLDYKGYLVTDATATFSDELQDAAELVMSSMTTTLTTTDDAITALGGATS
jgi:nicotinamidase-related amidase